MGILPMKFPCPNCPLPRSTALPARSLPIPMATDFISSSKEAVGRVVRRHKGLRRFNSFIIWTVIISMLVAMNVAVWTFSLYVFGYPENPFNYRFLTKLEKLEPPKKYDIYGAPKGAFLTPEKLYTKYYPYNAAQLSAANSLLKRAYVRNFRDSDPLDYVRGTFRIYYVRDLTSADVFSTGLVIRAYDPEFPQVVIEFLMPMDKPAPEKRYREGDEIAIDVKGSKSFASVLHVEKLEDYRMCFTLIPVVYGRYTVAEDQNVQLAPPPVLNMDGTWPITRDSLKTVPVPIIEEAKPEIIDEADDAGDEEKKE